MSGKKHVFKIVPGKEVPNNKIKFIKWLNRDNSNASIKKVELVPLDDKNDRVLDSLPIKFCSKNLCRKQFLCIEEENEGSLTTKNLKPDSNLDDINNKYTFVYLDDRLVILGMKAKPDLFMFTGTLTCTSTIWEKGLQYQYVTWEESDASNNKYYFSDREGSILDSPYNETLQNIMSYYGEKQIIRDIILPNISKSILLSSAFAKVFAEDLTENQLEVFANTLNSDQLQALKDHLTDKQFQTLIDHLTDEQLQTLVDHLTNHQLQTLAQELNPEKLQIIVPILNDAQLEALVRDLNPEQVKEILPHLKVDQFKALIKTLNDEQFTVLAKDLAEHHLTILSKELEGDQLKALVNSLQEDQLKDLVNKLDPEKLEAIAQDLTDSNRIQMIIKSLADNPEKLQAFARNMSNEQFKELLDNIGAEELKDIIHKLPHEKVISVIGDLGSKDHSNAIIDVLKEKFNEQNEKMKDLMSKVDRMLPEESEADWNDAYPSTYVFQDVNAEFAVTDHLL